MGDWQTTYEPMIAAYKRESDRGCALILTANLDDRLMGLLKNFFVAEPAKRHDAMFKGSGCLATFSSRIRICYSTGLLNDDERHDLDLIRRIRNDFAHDGNSIGFEAGTVRDRCNSLRTYQNEVAAHPQYDFSGYNSRNKFQLAGVGLCLQLDHRSDLVVADKRMTPPSLSASLEDARTP